MDELAAKLKVVNDVLAVAFDTCAEGRRHDARIAIHEFITDYPLLSMSGERLTPTRALERLWRHATEAERKTYNQDLLRVIEFALTFAAADPGPDDPDGNDESWVH